MGSMNLERMGPVLDREATAPLDHDLMGRDRLGGLHIARYFGFGDSPTRPRGTVLASAAFRSAVPVKRLSMSTSAQADRSNIHAGISSQRFASDAVIRSQRKTTPLGLSIAS